MNQFKIKNTLFIILIGFLTLIMFSSCANNEVVETCLTGHKYGFWGGLLHGIIAPFDLIAMLFNDNVTVYAQNNNGAWYAFGFIIGSGGWGILGSKSTKMRRRRNK